MRWACTILIAAALALAGCAGAASPPRDGGGPDAALPLQDGGAAVAAAPPAGAAEWRAEPGAPRVRVDTTGDVISESPDLPVWAERRTDPAMSRLVIDPVTGVWGGQDGELFHFRLHDYDYTYGRITYGRPDPAAVWLGDLVWVAEGRLVGRVETLHLMRRTADGQVTDLGPARSPAGAPYAYMDRRDGEVHLRDELGHWYRWDDEGPQPVREFTSAVMQGTEGLTNRHRADLEEAFRGRVEAAVTRLSDRSVYALVRREQLFLFDAAAKEFRLLGHPGLEPFASLDGRVVARFDGGLAVVDVDSGEVREIAVQGFGPWHAPADDGWVYNVPFKAVNVRTGEVREYIDGTPRGGSVSALVPYDEGRFVGATDMFGSLFLWDPATGQAEMWGRPIPELGQESGEEVAPITGLAWGSDGFLYASIGTGARGKTESHLVRLDRSGNVLARTWLPDPVWGLTAGADGRIYGSGWDRVVVVPVDEWTR